MSKSIFPLALLASLVVVEAALAQQPAAPKAPRLTADSHVQATPEMWFYEQQIRRYDDPQMAVRRNAEQRALQRRSRIAAMKWYGYSNSRPVANSTPWGASYSAHWGGNTRRPLTWGTGGWTVIYRVPAEDAR